MAKKKEGLTVAVAVGKPKTPPPADDIGLDDLAEEAPPEDDYLAENAGGEEPPPEEESEGAYPEFSIPEGLDLADMEPGEEKQVLCLISKTSDGTACIKQVDGVDLAGEGQGMYGPPPAAPVSPPPMGPPPPGMLAGRPPMGPPPGGLVRGPAAARGLM